MKLRIYQAGLALAAISLAATLPAGFASAQQVPGRLYAFHSARVGGCPPMDWHIVLTPDQALNGFVAWDQMTHVAKVHGSLQTGRVFDLSAVEQGGGGRTATIKGQVEDTFIVATIDGTKTACDKQQISVPYFAGGLSGGGG